MVGNKKVKNKAAQKDLKSYFSQGSSGSSPSAHGSVVTIVEEVEDVHLEENVWPTAEEGVGLKEMSCHL